MKKLACLILFGALSASPALADPDPAEIVRDAIDNWRGTSSYIEQTMIVHRPEWERSSAMVSITRGNKDALVRFTAPARDEGNATLKLDRDMWVFTPRLTRVIKLPASMMAQSWMGSDFSYDDLSKTDALLTDYELSIQTTEEADGHEIYVIEAVPHDDAPVVWGREVLRIRDDSVFLERDYYDQTDQLVKRMIADRIGPLDGRPYPQEMRMVDVEEEDHWTLVVTQSGKFDVEPPSFLFTQSNLRNPRDWSPR
ncbi:MAG: outer membrane lipoprotein-sorting protein [Rhodobiaceae bacterium]|nr:outer membrane lipoprotein-sorting protein [Rhodobiaceae bacterium]